MMSGGRENILTFLQEAELSHYYSALAHDLRVTSVSQIKYVEDEDLADIGMSKPEMRRLRKFYNKACPKGFGKLKKILTTKSGGQDSPSPEIVPPYPSSPHIARSLTEPGHMILSDAITAYKRLGEGQFATVQQGIWTTDSAERVQVALKRIQSSKMETSTGDFVREAGELILSGCEHIVQLYGVVVQPDSVMLVMELAPLRSLLECLKEPSLRSTFTVSLLCEFALQVAEGMTFLESKSLVHRDLAARNVLVFTKDKVKVSDYGLTKALGVGPEHYQTNLSLNLNLPIAWCAPECIHQKLFTSASDVWAYGVTLWEMFSFGFQPWAAFTGEQVLAAIDEPSCQRLEQPDACPSGHYTLMGQCWNNSPELRPKFSLISHRLHQIKPERVEALTDSSGLLKQDQLILKCQDVVTVLDKQPTSAPSPGMWKGVMDNGKVGYIEPSLIGPCVEMRNGSPAHRTRSTKLTRKESARKSMSKGAGSKKLSTSMISGPKSDLRHTGHIGYDGAVFGDVSFIGNNYDKLPVRVGSTYAPTDEMSGSTISLPVTEKDRASLVASTQARLSYLSTNSNDAESVNTRLSDSDTLTDVSSMVDDTDGMHRCRSEDGVLDHTVTHSISQPFDDFGDLKMPDFSGELGLDFGSSFMDEVMKALDDKPPQNDTTSPPRTKSEVRSEPAPRQTQPTKAEDSFLTDKSPLLEISKPAFGDNGSTFDNVALASEDYGDDDDRFSCGTRGSYGSQLKDSGIMEASFASVEISDYSKLSDESPSREDEKKKTKPKLKLIMPSRGEASKKEGIQPMSASDEKILNEAIELANEFANRQNAENMSPAVTDSQERLSATPGSTDGADFLDSSWGSTSKFGVRKKSPKQEKRSFSEEIAARPHDMNEELTAEAQEAYNMLVVKGTKDKEKDSFKAIRERRSQRGMMFNSHDSDTDKAAHTALSARNGRQVNMNIRKPQGIPTRAGVGLRGASVETSTDEQDTNPLRRLRDSQSSVTTKSRLSSRNELVNGQGDGVQHANLNPNLSFFAKLKEQEMANGKQEGSNPTSNPIPVPPRVPLRTSTINAKPRERIHNLDLGPDHASNPSHSEKPPTVNSRPSQLSSSRTEQKHSRSGDDSVFSESKSHFVFPGGQPISPVSPLTRPFSVSSSDSAVSMNVKSVTASAHDLGIDDNSDTFWLQEFNFEDLVVHDFDRAMVEDENAPIPGRYKTSDTVSYEDLMEFALDGPHPRDTDFNTLCDEVRLMRRVLSKDITVEDCMCALEETDWVVYSAIKLLKLKQLLSTGLGDQERCKSALMRCMWSINEAANYLLAISSGSDSPDLVHV